MVTTKTGKDVAGVCAKDRKIKQLIRHTGCGGQLAVGGTIHPLVDFGFGFRGSKFVVDRKYSRKVIGYSGFCLKCQASGQFLFKEYADA